MGKAAEEAKGRREKYSQYQGVSYHKRTGRWTAFVRDMSEQWFMRRQKYLGTFDTELDAARAYNEAAQGMFGDKAILNELPDDPPPPTPEEIAAACEAIRSGWTDHEYAQRAPHLAPLPVPAFDD